MSDSPVHRDARLALDLLQPGAGFLDRLPLLWAGAEPAPEETPGAAASPDSREEDSGVSSAWRLALEWSEKGENERATEAAIRAAQGALRKKQPGEAAERFTFALRHLARRDPRRGALRRRQAEALGAAARYRDAARAFGAAVRLADTRAERADLAVRQAEVLIAGGKHRRARQAVAAVRGLARGTRQREVQARARRVDGLASAALGELDRARAALEDAVGLFDKLDDAAPQSAETACSLGLVLWRAGDSGAAEQLRAALDAAKTAGAAATVEDCMTALAVVEACQGRPRRADRWREELARGGPKTRSRVGLVCSRLAAAALARGQLDRALEQVALALEAAEGRPLPGAELSARCLLAEIQRASGRADQAVAGLREALRSALPATQAELLAVARLLLASAMIDAVGNDAETARALVERARAELATGDHGWPRLLGLVVELERLESHGGSATDQEATLEELAARSDRQPQDTDPELRIRGDLVRSKHLARRGDLDGARAAADRAVETAAAAGRPLLEAVARIAQRDVLLRAGSADAAKRSLEAARRLLDTVAHGIEDDGVRRDLLARKDLRSLQRAPSFGLGADRRLSALYEMIRVLNSETDPDALLESILDMALAAVKAERGLVLLREPGDAGLAVKLARNLDPEVEVEVGSFSRGVVTRAAAGESLLVLDAGRDERFRDLRSVSVFGIRSLMCVPLRSRNEVVGAVYLDSRHEAGLFTRADLRFLEAFAEHATLALDNSRRRAELEQANRRLRAAAQQRVRFGSLVGRSPAMQRVFNLIERFAASDLPVLIRGESGTGKELVARAIHSQGPRQRKVFLSENCAAIPDSLLESELFGHVKGAFTGADRDRAGLFAQADGGTLFLDEVGDMSQAMQAKLLRAIQTGEIRPVGGNGSFHVDVRLLAATHRDLEADQAAGRFREDLYYRLQVLVAQIPPLRERPEDIRPLCDHLLGRIARERGSGPVRLEPEVLERLELYGWPGNVRQLENTLQRLALLAGDVPVTLDHVRMDDGLRGMLLAGEAALDAGLSLAASERERIEQALVATGGNRERAARLLGISRATIYRKIKHHGLL
jgi:Nif-specific regulatory protein